MTIADTGPRSSHPALRNLPSSDVELSRKSEMGLEGDIDVVTSVNPALVRSAQWKIDLVVIPLVTMYCA